MKKQPIVSIIIAVYNGGATFQQCLNSIFRQTYPNREIIVIDGGSTDGSVEILQRNASKLTYWISEGDKGIYDAWNKGLKRAKGDWITFIGCDDLYATENTLSKLVSLANRRAPVDFVAGKATMLDQMGRVKRIKGQPWRWRRFRRSMGVFVHPVALHHKSLFERFGCFDTEYHIAGDYEFLLRAGPTLRTAFLPDVVVNRGSEGVSNQFMLKAYQEAYAVQRQSDHINSIEAAFYFLVNLIQYYLGSVKHFFLKRIVKPRLLSQFD